MIRIHEALLCDGRLRLPKRYYYRLRSHDPQLWLSREGNTLVLSPSRGDSIAMIKKLPEGIYLQIPPDLLEGIAAFNGDTLSIELLEPPYDPPKINISVVIGEITPELLASVTRYIRIKIAHLK